MYCKYDDGLDFKVLNFSKINIFNIIYRNFICLKAFILFKKKQVSISCKGYDCGHSHIGCFLICQSRELTI